MKKYLLIEGYQHGEKVYHSDQVRSGITSCKDGLNMDIVLTFEGIYRLFRYERLKDFSESMFRVAVEKSGVQLEKVIISFFDEKSEKCNYSLEVETNNNIDYKLLGRSFNDDGTCSTWRTV